MSGYNSKPVYSEQGDNRHRDAGGGPFHSDSIDGNWLDSDGFTIGFGYQPEVLAISGFAESSVDINLQAAVPTDYASISFSLANVVNVDAFANVAASGSVTSAAASQASLTLTNGKLTGEYTAALSIDVTAFLAADHATVHMHVTDSFQMCLSGTGYIGASLADISASGGTVEAIAPTGGGGSAKSSDGGTFDLARFAASVLNTGQWSVAFVASAAGESLNGWGESILTISATADLPGKYRPETLNFHDVERSKLAFSDSSTPVGGLHSGMPPGMQVSSSEPLSLFHNA